MTSKTNADVGDFLQGLFGCVDPAPAKPDTVTEIPSSTKASHPEPIVTEINNAGETGAAIAVDTDAPVRRERREWPALAVGDQILESPVGAGTITSFTGRGVPRIKEVPAAWLKRADGFVYDPMNRRRS